MSNTLTSNRNLDAWKNWKKQWTAFYKVLNSGSNEELCEPVKIGMSGVTPDLPGK